MFGFSGALAFDVGGNWGHVAARLAQRFGHVVSFEPADESFGILAENAAEVPNLEAVQLAVTDHDGPARLDVQENSIRTGQLTTHPGDSVPEGLSEATWGPVLGQREVPGARLDALAERYGTPDFIKIDVEGHEVAVIRGARQVLQSAPQLFIEIHHADLGEQIADLLRPTYGGRLRVVRHPHYRTGSWGLNNHYYLLAE
ncbi:FkbM family methyltransferase [Streptomyces sp. 891-h]|uniref:FkbM family methyltransferase n=1 Tax=Streptomyces sp. 891-h TaxID=2720714 RepID=UPI001FA9B825|nr:FkbM family methyltransferase [Streptomyces sp. 891-h]UNZ20622.1 FkbM family methyltransferase [Streptomyces sp. 891-h]